MTENVKPPEMFTVKVNKVDLYHLAEFFGEDGTMPDDVYDRVGRKFLIAAVKAGVYDDVEGE